MFVFDKELKNKTNKQSVLSGKMKEKERIRQKKVNEMKKWKE
jgi:hypothetical protein